MKKRIVFFDGDGTLWYPKKTKYSEVPSWIYRLPGNAKFHNKQLILTPTMLRTIKKLKKMGIITVIISTHPHPPKEAAEIIREKIRHFNLKGLFDEIFATPAKGPNKSKAKVILKVLKRRRIPKKYALMVGDSYGWDYRAGKEAGIDSLIIATEHNMKNHPIVKRIKNKIRRLSDVLDKV